MAFLLLRFSLLVLLSCSLLVTVSIASGQRSESTLRVNSEEVHGQRYLLSIEDLANGIHFEMAGTHCATASPIGIYANLDADPPIVAYPSRRVISYTRDLSEALAACQPLDTARSRITSD